jgi:DNA replication and repair protein RecF
LTSSVSFQQVSLRGFRNIRALDFEPNPGLNLVVGHNGQGKTSLLEALYLVTTTKSFRAERLAEVVQEGSDLAVVRVNVLEEGCDREQRLVVASNRRSLLLDGKRPRTLVAYATRTPVVLFHPADLNLVGGSASLRRTLLDRIALFLDIRSLEHRAHYLEALRERQRLLEESGPHALGIDPFERLMAEHGSAFARVRARAAGQLLAALGPVHDRIAPAGNRLEAQYRPGGSQAADEFQRQLAELRDVDLRRGQATYGPHRDELELMLNGRSARRHASQGQQRLLTLACKLAELECLRAAREAHPVLLLDDMSSELDPPRTEAVCALLDQTQSQVFITTTRPEVLDARSALAGARSDFLLENGILRQVR